MGFMDKLKQSASNAKDSMKKTIRRVSNQEHMPTPLPPNGCKSNPSGKKYAPHVMIKTS